MAPNHPENMGKTNNVAQVLTSISDDKMAKEAKEKLKDIANQQFSQNNSTPKFNEENDKLHQCEKCLKNFGSILFSS